MSEDSRVAMSQRYEGFLRRATRGTFGLWQRLGFHVTPVHFYQPIPDTRTLPPELWDKPSEMLGVDFDVGMQLDLLGEIEQFRSEYERFPKHPDGSGSYHVHNGFFDTVDAEVLYGLIRLKRPRRVVEIGAGYSTLVSAAAILENERDGSPRATFVAIDPYPAANVRDGVPGLTQLLVSPVEEVDPALFDELGEGDILFIDSSHVVRIGGDVTYEFLELLPRLREGVLVHVHDIFLPYEYPREWIMQARQFWTEQYLLQAFLAFNDRFRVIWAGHYLHVHHSERLRGAFPSYGPHAMSPRSFWLERTRLESQA